jgi:hypothetical protein
LGWSKKDLYLIKVIRCGMDRLIGLKENGNELFFQAVFSDKFFKFMDELCCMVFDECWIVDSQYQSGYAPNSHLSFEKDGVYLSLVMANKRVFVTVLGYENHKKLKDLLVKYYKF